MRSRGRGQANQTHTETHLAMCLALSSMARLLINTFEVRVRAFCRKPLPFVYNITFLNMKTIFAVMNTT